MLCGWCCYVFHSAGMEATQGDGESEVMGTVKTGSFDDEYYQQKYDIFSCTFESKSLKLQLKVRCCCCV